MVCGNIILVGLLRGTLSTVSPGSKESNEYFHLDGQLQVDFYNGYHMFLKSRIVGIPKFFAKALIIDLFGPGQYYPTQYRDIQEPALTLTNF